MQFNSSFGVWLRQRRKALDLTQAELADQVGCSAAVIRKFEANERRPSKQICEVLSEVLAIMPEERDAFIAFARGSGSYPGPPSPPAVASASAHNLPFQTPPFVGRTAELDQIAQQLDDPACRLLTLVGFGGIGKTRLAIEAARRNATSFADGVLFVSLVALSQLHILNRYTLSVIFDKDIADAAWLRERREHVEDVLMAYLAPTR